MLLSRPRAHLKLPPGVTLEAHRSPAGPKGIKLPFECKFLLTEYLLPQKPPVNDAASLKNPTGRHGVGEYSGITSHIP